MMISCFILHVIYWAFGVVGWWTFFRWRHWNCAMMISSFNLLWALLFALVLWWQCHYILPIRFCMCCFVFRYSLHFVRLSLSISPLSVMSSHDLLVVLLLTTPHSQWCIYFYPSLSTFLQNPLSCRLKQLELRSYGSARLESELVSSFAFIDCYKQISIPLNEFLWISYPIKWFIEEILCRLL